MAQPDCKRSRCGRPTKLGDRLSIVVRVVATSNARPPGPQRRREYLTIDVSRVEANKKKKKTETLNGKQWCIFGVCGAVGYFHVSYSAVCRRQTGSPTQAGLEPETSNSQRTVVGCRHARTHARTTQQP